MLNACEKRETDMRRRRKFKGTWFPAYGQSLGTNEPDAMGLVDSIETNADGHVVTKTFRLLPDEPAENIETDRLLSMVGQEYALRRIVGKLGIVWTGSSGVGGEPANVAYAKVACGLFVARAEDSALSENVPIGLADNEFDSDADPEEFNSYSPLALKTIREPWIWRRTWLLGKQVAISDGGGGSAALYESAVPSSNLKYGSVMDGPHLDAKTRRRVRQDERLWFAIAAVNWPTGSVAATTYTLTFDFDLDLRFFGAMRKARNQGAF